MVKNPVSFHKSSILYLVLTVLLVEPEYIGTIHIIDNIFYDMLGPIIFAVLVLFTTLRRVWNKELATVAGLYLMMGLITILHGGDTRALVLAAMRVMAFALFLNIGIRKSGSRFLRMVGYVYLFYAVINLLSMIIFPNGLFALASTEHSWFIGHKNTLMKFLLPGLFFSVAGQQSTWSRLEKQSKVFLVVIVITAIIGQSSTGLVSISLFLICWVIGEKFKRDAGLSALYIGLGINIAFFLGIVILRWQRYFSFIITNMFDKQLTLTGRTSLWDNIIPFIRERPIFGYGLEKLQVIQMRLQYTNPSTHNIILDYWYEGGIVCLAILMCMVIFAQRGMNRLKQLNKYSLIILDSILIAYSILLTDDTFVREGILNLVGMLTVCASIDCTKTGIDRDGTMIRSEN